MLTEGWDVPNVFQVVPWETRAFDSKLLIAQVLGRGLRVPPGLDSPVLLTVENHERWTDSLKNLFFEVLEIENRVASAPMRSQFSFPLFNLRYTSEQVTEQTTTRPAGEPERVAYGPQAKQVRQSTTYSRSGEHVTTLDVPDWMPMEHAVARIWSFLDEKNEAIAAKWPKQRIREFIESNLRDAGQDADYMSRENLTKTQNAFGPMFRTVGATVPRKKLKPDALFELDMMTMAAQSVSEDQLRNNTVVYYTDDAIQGFKRPEDKALWSDWQKKREAALLTDVEEIAHFPQALKPVPAAKFKCPTNLLVARFQPERIFIDSVIVHSELFDDFAKNADMGFYSFPYSYKSSMTATSHAKTENFNPDFFLKLAASADVLVIEIKTNDDDSRRNKAKNRDAKEHFLELNKQLEKCGQPWRYHFYFLSQADYGTFFTAMGKGRLEYKSSLMTILETPDA